MTHKKGFHPMNLGLQPMFEGLLRAQAPSFMIGITLNEHRNLMFGESVLVWNMCLFKGLVLNVRFHMNCGRVSLTNLH